jgi:uridine kinase
MWKPRRWDSYHEYSYDEPWVTAPANPVVIVAGIFLQHPELRPAWDYLIWLAIDWGTMIARAAERDTAWVGSRELVIKRYQSFWIPAHERYEERFNPTHFSHLLVDNRHPARPAFIENPD